MTKTAHLASAIVLVVLLLFIHNAAAFLVLIFGLGYVFTITESGDIIETSLRPFFPKHRHVEEKSGEGQALLNEKEDGLQLVFNVINSSIQQSDALSSKNGIKSVSKIMEKIQDDYKLFEKCTTNMMNSAKRALLLGDEATAICIIKAVERNYPTIDQRNGLHLSTKETIQLYSRIIDSYSSLSQFSVERGYIESTLSGVDSLMACNKVLLECCISETFKSGNLPMDVSPGDQGKKESNPYDLSQKCVKSASIVSQIAAQKNYEMLVVDVSAKMSLMHAKLSDCLERPLYLPESTETVFLIKLGKIPNPETWLGLPGVMGVEQLPIGLIEHYIWSIKDAGVSAAENGQEKAAIDYITSLKGFGRSLFALTNQYHYAGSIQHIAKLIAHTSTAIREIGQELAEKKLQQGTIRAILAITDLAKLVPSSDMMWIPGNKTGDCPQKLAFVRITWNLKDVGRSAAEHGIEKAIVRAVEKLFDLLKVSLDPNTNWNDKAKKTKVLLRIGEGFYEITMKTKNQNLQEALTKIIYFNVCCIGCLDATATRQTDNDKDYDHKLVMDIFLKTFVHLEPIDNFSEATIQVFLESDRFNQKSPFYDKYSNFIPRVSWLVCDYISQKSPPRLPDPGAAGR